MESYIREKLKAKEPFFKIKSELQKQGLQESKVDEKFIKIVRVKFFQFAKKYIQ